jgi:1,4-alpha-glucan branching enzyme
MMDGGMVARQGGAGAVVAVAVGPRPNVMGATAHDGGCTFRIWAPFASAVSLKTWSGAAAPIVTAMVADSADGYGNACWSVFAPGVTAPTSYRYVITYNPPGQPPRTVERADPWGRAIVYPNWTPATRDDSDARSLVTATDFAWQPAPALPDWRNAVLYQLHVGSFAQPAAGSADPIGDLIGQIPYLERLGVNVVQLLPFTEFASSLSLGYNSVLPFAIEHDYGDPNDFKRLVAALHAAGMRVLIDVVFNHIDTDEGGRLLPYSLFQFDGWSTPDNSCGVFFYGGDELLTPWGPRPDYGRPEVQRYLQDNIAMWLGEYRVDGVRFDSTKCIRLRQGPCGQWCCGTDIGVERNFGWELMQNVNRSAHALNAQALTIAEDLDGNGAITSAADSGGAGFDAQWDADLQGAVLRAVTQAFDANVDVGAIASALERPFEGDPWRRVIYLESHDQAKSQRVPAQIQPANPTDWYARKKSMLGFGVVATATGVPMLFQGAEALEIRTWNESVPMDFTLERTRAAYFRFYGDMIRLRTNAAGRSAGLSGAFTHVVQANPATKVLAYHRWDRGSGIDDVIVVANFSSTSFPAYTIGVPYDGTWYVRLNSDANVYSDQGDFGSVNGYDTAGVAITWDGMPFSANVGLGPYSILVLSR